jgi:hypothetical protein
MAKETGWSIAGPYGLYVGWWMTRTAAIRAHVSQKLGVGGLSGPLTPRQKEAWQSCRRAGDRAVKVMISYSA